MKRNAKANMRRWGRLAYGVLVMIAVGFAYGWSIFSVPFQQEFGWSAQTLSLNFSILMLCFCAGGLAGARVVARFSTRAALFLSALMICMGFFGALLVRQEAPWILYLTYALFGGLASGVVYTTIMAAIIPWFPDRTGLASGILLMCYSSATMLLGSAAALLFTLVGWRQTFVIFACAITTVLLAGIPLARKPTSAESDAIDLLARKRLEAKASRHTIGQTQEDATLQKNHQERDVLKAMYDYSTRQMLKTPVFYVYGIWMLLLSSMGLGLTGHMNQVALSLGMTTAVAVAFVILHSLTNALGRAGMGSLFDALGLTGTMILAAALETTGAVLIFSALVIDSSILLAFAVALYSIGMAGVPVMGSGFMAKFFGPSHYQTNLAVLNLIIIPAGFIGPSLMSFFIMSTGSYANAMLALAGFGILAIICAFAIRLMQRHI